MSRTKEKSLYTGISTELALGQEILLHHIQSYKFSLREEGRRDPIEHYKARIKEESSMTNKLTRYGLPVTQQAALTEVYDLIGIRVVVTLISDIYAFVEAVENTDIEIITIKDYVKNPKPNGYRSVHLIVRLPIGVEGVTENLYAEIQIRTIAMDCWASLEHQLKYKKDFLENVDLIEEELRRCAAEIAATDLALESIKDMIDQQERLEAAGNY